VLRYGQQTRGDSALADHCARLQIIFTYLLIIEKNKKTASNQ